MAKVENFTEKFHSLIGVEDSYRAPEALMKILYNREQREKMFREMLEWFDYDVDYDWFHQYFQNEHSDRKKKKQDFTPNELGELTSKLTTLETGGEGDYYEVAAGTGGMMIQHWDTQRMKTSPLAYSTWDYFHVVEEISDRAIPFLLFNMMIRGMNGIVIHGDCISRNAKGIFFIQNFTDDHLGFSDLNVLPYTQDVADNFAVQFEWVVSTPMQTDTKGKRKSTVGYYPKHIERSWYDKENIDYIFKKLEEKRMWEQMRKETQEDQGLTPEVKALLDILGM